jgi:23S rRNA pseudouridine1911/1915/1917 synthase
MDSIQRTMTVPDEFAGQRLDQTVAQLFSDFSRSRLQEWIKSGSLLVDGQIKKPREKLLGGEYIEINATLEPNREWEAEPMDLPIVYEDEDILVLNKPVGLVVHPAAGHQGGTLLNALLHHHPDLAQLPRAGIVHRLDKDTSGLMVVAKNLVAHADLVGQLQLRTVSREYEAITMGVMTGGGTVEAAVGRHPTDRKKQAVIQEGFSGGKHAVTHYRVLKKFFAHTHIRVKLETGRMHQIRVHMAHMHYPLVGDATYGGRLRLPQGATAELQEALRGFSRQALHAKALGLEHPRTGEHMQWEVDLPADMQHLLTVLNADLLARKHAE